VCDDLAAKEEVSKKKKERENRKTYQCSSIPPNATSRGVPEVAVRKGGRRWTEKRERRRDSEVAVKKTLLKRG
jgi:hypothetical protein